MDWRRSVARADERERQAAESARYRLNIPQNARVDVFGAIVAAGIRLLRYPLGDNGLLGVYKRLPGEAFVLINSSQTPVRQRFTAAHELGHHFLGIGGEQEHFDTNQTLFAASDRPANWFAGYFLIDEPGARMLAEAESPMRATLRVAEFYDVSVEAAAIQLETFGLITGPEKKEIDAERKQFEVLADFYHSQDLAAPPTQRPDESIAPDPTYAHRAEALAEAGLLDAAQKAEILFRGARPPRIATR
jgi:Zn-dependent peptidase ImmA (M78 family)